MRKFTAIILIQSLMFSLGGMESAVAFQKRSHLRPRPATATGEIALSFQATEDGGRKQQAIRAVHDWYERHPVRTLEEERLRGTRFAGTHLDALHFWNFVGILAAGTLQEEADRLREAASLQRGLPEDWVVVDDRRRSRKEGDVIPFSSGDREAVAQLKLYGVDLEPFLGKKESGEDTASDGGSKRALRKEFTIQDESGETRDLLDIALEGDADFAQLEQWIRILEKRDQLPVKSVPGKFVYGYEKELGLGGERLRALVAAGAIRRTKREGAKGYRISSSEMERIVNLTDKNTVARYFHIGHSAVDRLIQQGQLEEHPGVLQASGTKTISIASLNQLIAKEAPLVPLAQLADEIQKRYGISRVRFYKYISNIATLVDRQRVREVFGGRKDLTESMVRTMDVRGKKVSRGMHLLEVWKFVEELKRIQDIVLGEEWVSVVELSERSGLAPQEIRRHIERGLLRSLTLQTTLNFLPREAKKTTYVHLLDAQKVERLAKTRQNPKIGLAKIRASDRRWDAREIIRLWRTLRGKRREVFSFQLQWYNGPSLARALLSEFEATRNPTVPKILEEIGPSFFILLVTKQAPRVGRTSRQEEVARLGRMVDLLGHISDERVPGLLRVIKDHHFLPKIQLVAENHLRRIERQMAEGKSSDDRPDGAQNSEGGAAEDGGTRLTDFTIRVEENEKNLIEEALTGESDFEQMQAWVVTLQQRVKDTLPVPHGPWISRSKAAETLGVSIEDITLLVRSGELKEGEAGRIQAGPLKELMAKKAAGVPPVLLAQAIRNHYDIVRKPVRQYLNDITRLTGREREELFGERKQLLKPVFKAKGKTLDRIKRVSLTDVWRIGRVLREFKQILEDPAWLSVGELVEETQKAGKRMDGPTLHYHGIGPRVIRTEIIPSNLKVSRRPKGRATYVSPSDVEQVKRLARLTKTHQEVLQGISPSEHQWHFDKAATFWEESQGDSDLQDAFLFWLKWNQSEFLASSLLNAYETEGINKPVLLHFVKYLESPLFKKMGERRIREIREGTYKTAIVRMGRLIHLLGASGDTEAAVELMELLGDKLSSIDLFATGRTDRIQQSLNTMPDRIQGLRKRAGLTPSEAQQRIGMSPESAYWASLEKGRVTPSLASIFKIGWSFGEPVSSILLGRDRAIFDVKAGSFAKELQKARTQEGWSRLRLANVSGVDEEHLRLLEEGQLPTRARTALKLLYALQAASEGPFVREETVIALKGMFRDGVIEETRVSPVYRLYRLHRTPAERRALDKFLKGTSDQDVLEEGELTFDQLYVAQRGFLEYLLDTADRTLVDYLRHRYRFWQQNRTAMRSESADDGGSRPFGEIPGVRDSSFGVERWISWILERQI